MLHRHLNHQNFTLTAIDDIVARGNRRDWAACARLSSMTLWKHYANDAFDRLYPQPNGESALQQLQIQLAHPLRRFDL